MPEHASDGTWSDGYNDGYDDGYNHGFARGGEAVVQQIDGIMMGCITSYEAYRRINSWIHEFWKERES